MKLFETMEKSTKKQTKQLILIIEKLESLHIGDLEKLEDIKLDLEVGIPMTDQKKKYLHEMIKELKNHMKSSQKLQDDTKIKLEKDKISSTTNSKNLQSTLKKLFSNLFNRIKTYIDTKNSKIILQKENLSHFVQLITKILEKLKQNSNYLFKKKFQNLASKSKSNVELKHNFQKAEYLNEVNLEFQKMRDILIDEMKPLIKQIIEEKFQNLVSKSKSNDDSKH